MLEGQVDQTQTELRHLRAEVERLTDELEVARLEVRNARSQATRAVQALRQQTGGLFQALKILHGEMDKVAPDQPSGSSSNNDADKWTVIKQRLSPRLREAIDLLLLQGQMKRTQLASALKMDYSNCTKNVVGVLKAQGLMIEDNGYLSLKQF